MSDRDPAPRWVRAAVVALTGLTFALAAARGSRVLDNTYHFDERYSLHNVSALLVDGTLRPANAFYPSLSYLPQGLVLAASEGLHRWTGIEALTVFDPRAGDGWSRTAYLLCRLMAALYAGLAVALLYRVGRRLFDPWVGLVAALLLAATPALILTGSVFKPDVLVLLLTVLALDWTEAALAEPRLSSYLRAGAGVGLAVAAKYTGVGAALPLALGALAAGRRDRRQWIWLPLTALAAVATFVVLNPYLSVIFRYLRRVLTIYERKGAAAGGSRLEVVAAQAGYIVRHHGVVIALFAAAGAVLLLVGARRVRAPAQRRAALLVLGYAIGYSALYAAATTLFKGQNYLPILAFTSLLASGAIVAAWRAVRVRVPGLERRAVRVAATAGGGLVVLWLLGGQVLFVYRQIVPSTYDAAWSFLALKLRPLGLRQVAYEKDSKDRDRLIDGSSEGLMLRVEIAAEHENDLRVSDAEVFYRDRAGEPGSFAAERFSRTRWESVQLFRAGPFERHGETVAVVLHPWRPDPDLSDFSLPVRADSSGLRAVLPDQARPGDVLGLELLVPRAARGLDAILPEPGGERLAVFAAGQRPGKKRLLTPRFVLGEGQRHVRILVRRPLPPHGLDLRLHRFVPEAPRATTESARNLPPAGR